jgi:GNAT superfamily N-acetyltransferase
LLQKVGLTEAQQILPSREYLGRGIESLVVLPGRKELNDSIATKTVALVSSTFHSDQSVPLDERPAATWERSLRKRMSGESYFIETDPGYEGHIGVFDAVFIYFARKEPTTPLSIEEIPDARLVGIHGLYHYLTDPTVYYGVRFAVDPELQGQGIGRKIMCHNLQQCLRLGAQERQIFTEADPIKNKAVLEIYGKWGFLPTGRSMEYNGEQQVFLAAKLAPGTKSWEMAKQFEAEDGPPVKW